LEGEANVKFRSDGELRSTNGQIRNQLPGSPAANSNPDVRAAEGNGNGLLFGLSSSQRQTENRLFCIISDVAARIVSGSA